MHKSDHNPFIERRKIEQPIRDADPKELLEKKIFQDFVGKLQDHAPMMELPFPFREGKLLGRFVIPRDLTSNEVERITKFLEAMVIPDEPR